MNPPTFKARMSFQAKVLIPVVCVMILLTAVTVWLVNQRIGEQLEAQASERLNTAKKHFQTSQEIRANSLIRQYRNLNDEPRFNSFITKICTEDAFQEQVQNLLQSGTAANTLTEPEAEKLVQKAQTATATNFLEKFLKEREITTVACIFPEGAHPLFAFASGDSKLNGAEFQAFSRLSVKRAYDGGEPVVDTIGVGSRLLDIVSIPVSVHDQIVGVLTFGLEIGPNEARQMKQMTGSEVVLLAGGKVAASSLRNPDSQPALAGQIHEFSAAAGPTATSQPRKILLSGQHYICVPGHIPSLNGDAGLG